VTAADGAAGSQEAGRGTADPAGAGATPLPAGGTAARAAAARAADGGSTVAGSTEPDARFTFANERTFLAWTRTALAFVVAGLGVVQLLPAFPGVPWGRHIIGVPLIILGGVIAVVGYSQWTRNQRALRRGDPIPPSPLPRVLATTITALAIVAAVILLISAIRD
jgi:putative membrane protein